MKRLGLEQIMGQSPAFLAEMKKIIPLGKCDAGILIRGETRTGKELVARAIHYMGSRADKPFVPFNCGAIPPDLVENELFGHERGAFTGASSAATGLVREANGGTLFMDEVDTLLPLSQVKLLRFVQEKEYRPIGATKISRADVRIITATNANLEHLVECGRFRRDLYYRLNVIPIVLPPLRNRPGDIPLLARHFVGRYCTEFQKPGLKLSPEALRRLEMYKWPGNVRELEHIVEQSVLLCEGNTISAEHILIPSAEASVVQESFQEMKAKVILNFERSYLESMLALYQDNITKAARAAKKERRTFWELIRKHRIDVEKFRLNIT